MALEDTATPLQSKLYRKEIDSDVRVKVTNSGNDIVITPFGTTVESGESAFITVTEWDRISDVAGTTDLTLNAEYGTYIQEGCLVDEGASDADMDVAMSAGAYVQADGSYGNVVADTATVTAAPSTGNKRIDLAVLDISDDTLAIVAGTEVANADDAAVPATSDNQVALAEIAVANDVTAITDSDITDVRPRA